MDEGIVGLYGRGYCGFVWSNLICAGLILRREGS